MIRFLRKNIWITLGLIAIFIRVLFSLSPELYALLYRDGLFPIIRFIFDHTFGLLPFPAAYLFVPTASFTLVLLIGVWFKKLLVERKVVRCLLKLCNFFMGLIFVFLLLWGFHYARTPIENVLGLSVQNGMTTKELEEEINIIHNSCIDLRRQITKRENLALPDSIFPSCLSDTIRSLEKKTLDQIGCPVTGYVPARMIKPNGLLLRFNASGIYLPFTGEAHIENALPNYVKAFTIAHELAHGFGYGSEASCNFVAYITCIRSNIPAIQYAGQFTYLRYLLAELKKVYPDQTYRDFRDSLLHPSLQYDLNHLYDIYDSYPGIADQFQRNAYDLYLKSQGIKEGRLSYNRMILLCYAWRKLR